MGTREALGVDEVEPYSKIIKAGGFIFIKSHVGYDAATGEYPTSIAGQTKYTLDHLVRALDTAGASLRDAVKINVFLSRIDVDFDAMDGAYGAYFAERGIDEQPARTTIGVPLSWPQLLVQMELIAAS
jgi:enamine deaminase RidA (YjgF/YER057c/UK114 family)